jgi:hypothetical protein
VENSVGAFGSRLPAASAGPTPAPRGPLSCYVHDELEPNSVAKLVAKPPVAFVGLLKARDESSLPISDAPRD